MLLKSVEFESFARHIFTYSARNSSAYPHHKSLKAPALEYPFTRPAPWVCTRWSPARGGGVLRNPRNRRCILNCAEGFERLPFPNGGDNVLYHAQSRAQTRNRCLAYLAEKPVLRPLGIHSTPLPCHAGGRGFEPRRSRQQFHQSAPLQMKRPTQSIRAIRASLCADNCRSTPARMRVAPPDPDPQ